jgi:homoserine O-acetyltransferase/O-succinyltransferase
MVRYEYFLMLLMTVLSTPFSQAQDLKMAKMGDCSLESGQKILDCQLGYRTFGRLDPNKSNVILFPTWALGTSEQATNFVGPGKLLDSSKYFIVVIDSFGNGVSSSPSNSQRQPRMQFPQFTISDMVNAGHLLLTQELHINHLKAVIGTSMGGMQTFQWMVSYPDFMDKAIPISGSPRLAPYDLLLWRAEIDAIKRDPGWNGGEYTSNPAMLAEAEIAGLTITTPEEVDNKFSRDTIGSFPRASGSADANNHIRQCEAMMSLDVSRNFGGSLQKAAESTKAKVFVIVSKWDHTVTPQPALDFAGMLHAETLVLDSICGHMASNCEAESIARRVNGFLER